MAYEHSIAKLHLFCVMKKKYHFSVEVVILLQDGIDVPGIQESEESESSGLVRHWVLHNHTVCQLSIV